ncbi:MAG: hypothetical protein H6557_35830 [Lewinellaceae bacterium]|nr:hypothetical protein [Phaeodactylibacter sp.]MCB9042017.1 hypothetical protein [Lewinellaceae bacterium]
MKKILFIASLMLVFAACKNEKNKEAITEEEEPEMVEEDEVDVVPNSTDLDFDAAMDAYRKKDYEKASHYITTAIDDLKKDGAAVDAKSQKALDNTIAILQSLAEKVKTGKVAGEEELEALFAHVDMMTSHDYLLLTQVYAVNAPEKVEGAFRKAGDRMERATQKLDGEAKAEGNKILGAIKTDLGKTDIKANEIGNAAGKRVEEMAGWIKAHAEKLGIKAPAHSDF